jgi:integrase
LSYTEELPNAARLSSLPKSLTWTQPTSFKRGNIGWAQYYQNGQPIRESTGSTKETEVKRFLKLREGEVAQGKRVVIHIERLCFEELADDSLTDYRVNGKRSLDKAQWSVRHLGGYFAGMRVVDITTDKVRADIDQRQRADYSNAAINRELAALKRMFNLARQQTPPKITQMSYIPMLQEKNVRTGFFEVEAFQGVVSGLPAALRPVATFAHITGWRKAEVLALTWRQVDFEAEVVRLESGTTKNGEGRTFFTTAELKRLLEGPRL